MRKFITGLIIVATAIMSAAVTHAVAAEAGEITAVEVREGRCALTVEMIAGPDNGKFFNTEWGAVQVMRDTQKGLLEIEAPEDSKIISVMCARSTPIPYLLDYRVILSGYIFLTGSMDKDRAFRTILKKENGVYIHTMKTGSLSEAEQKFVDGILLQFLEDEKEFLVEAY